MGLAKVVSIGEPERRIRRFQIKYRTGMTIRVRMVELTIPPIIGAAICFMTSAPVQGDLLSLNTAGRKMRIEAAYAVSHASPCDW